MRALKYLVALTFTIFAPGPVVAATTEAASSATGCLPRSVAAPIAAFGAYESARSSSVTIGGADRRSVVISVIGDREGPDRTLLLMSYNPVVWDFTHAPINRIRAVIVSGYYDQAVSNLPPSIPVAFSARSGSAESCGGPGFTYQGGLELEEAVASVEGATGARVTSFGGAYSASAVVLTHVLTPSGDAPVVGNGPIRAAVAVNEHGGPQRLSGRGRLVLEDNRQWSGLPPVPPEIVELIDQRVVRPAEAVDVEAWNEAVTSRLQTGHLAPFRSERLHPIFAYVVLASMDVPEGVSQKQFIVPRGMPVPRDPSGLNALYLIESASCVGRGSECDEIEETLRLRLADARYHCTSARRADTLQPIGDGPARLAEVLCHRSSGYEYWTTMSGSGERIARISNQGEVSVASLRPMSAWAVWSENAARAIVGEQGARLHWDRSGRELWTTVQDRAERGGWAMGPVEIVRLTAGGERGTRGIRGSPGRLDNVQWVGDGLALAQFDARGSYYRPEREDSNPTLAMIDARRGRVLDAISFADLERLTGERISGREGVQGTVLANGDIRAVLETRTKLVIWTQGEEPRAIDKPFASEGLAVLAPDGRALLVTHMLRASGIICERNPQCPPPIPESGVWAARYDVEGRSIWTMEGTAETFDSRRLMPVVSDDGRFALMQLAPSARGQPSMALINMRDGAVLQRLPDATSFGFRDGGIWLEHGGLLAFYTLSR